MAFIECNYGVNQASDPKLMHDTWDSSTTSISYSGTTMTATLDSNYNGSTILMMVQIPYSTTIADNMKVTSVSGGELLSNTEGSGYGSSSPYTWTRLAIIKVKSTSCVVSMYRPQSYNAVVKIIPFKTN